MVVATGRHILNSSRQWEEEEEALIPLQVERDEFVTRLSATRCSLNLDPRLLFSVPFLSATKIFYAVCNLERDNMTLECFNVIDL